MTCGGADLALVKRLEGDVDESGVGGAAAAGEGDDIGHGRIALDHADDLLDRIVHRRKGGVLRALHAAGDSARVLLRKEALGNDDDQQHVERDRAAAAPSASAADDPAPSAGCAGSCASTQSKARSLAW